MARTPQEVFEHHMQALGAGMDEILADYTDDAVFLTKDGVKRGKEGVQQSFEQLFNALGEIKEVGFPVQIYEGDVLFLNWWADLGDRRCDGIDTFVFRDGLIRAQTLHYEIKPTG